MRHDGNSSSGIGRKVNADHMSREGEQRGDEARVLTAMPFNELKMSEERRIHKN